MQDILAIEYGVLGWHLVLSFNGDLTFPYSAELPKWINFFSFLRSNTFKIFVNPKK